MLQQVQRRKILRSIQSDFYKGEMMTVLTTPKHVDRLYKAVLNYVKKSGGKVDSISGVQIQDFANGIDFSVIIRCTGAIPEFAKPKPPTPEQVREACIEIIKSGRWIEAVKYHRSVAAVPSLKESKEYIDGLRAELSQRK
jgi:hypothetical protein